MNREVTEAVMKTNP